MHTLFIVCCIFNCRYASECFPVAYRPGRGSEILTQDLWTGPSKQHLETACFLYRVPGLCLQILKNQEYDIFTIEHPTARIKRSSSAACLFTGPSCPWSPVYVSQCLSLSTSKTLLRLCWCDWWWYQLNTIDDANMKQPPAIHTQWHMQVALADGQSKVVGILEVNWNINLKEKGERKKEIGGYENKKYLPLLEFCKNSQREQTISTQHAFAVGMIWVMDSIPWVRCASNNVYKTEEALFLIFVSPYFL